MQQVGAPASQPAWLPGSQEPQQIRLETVSLLLCTVDELVFVGSLVACLHSFVVPQLLRMVEELLSRRDTTFENDARRKTFKRERLAAT